LRKVLRGAFSQVAIGLAIGIPAAIGAGKLMTQQLFSVRPWDPVMLASATLALGLAALLASALPAWRAAGVEPMVAGDKACWELAGDRVDCTPKLRHAEFR
jgi:putative ABC transport system permease protein